MMRRAFEELGVEGLEDFLKGPSAIAFGMEDPASAAKISSEFAEDHEALEIKAGYVLSLIHISEPTRQCCTSRMPSSA